VKLDRFVPAIVALFRAAAVSLAALIWLGAAQAQHGLQPPDRMGFRGTMAVDMGKGVTTYWYDAGDGIQPGVGGCHIEVRSMTDRRPTGRIITEQCRADGLLVETTPEKGKIHPHENDIGHPYLFDCNIWCVGSGNGRGGSCRTFKTHKVNCPTSARCVCDRH
jgi:hypothetical protein